MIKNVISVIDGAAGSCGKAKVVGEIATDKNINLLASITNCMPNAGHTFVDEHGNKTIFRNIPVSCVNKNTELFIGPGSAIDMETFIQEYKTIEKYLGNRKIYVHERVPLIEQRHKDKEKQTIKSGSTFKGCGAVTQEKIIRDEKLKFFKTYKNAIVCSNDEWLDKVYNHLDNYNGYVMLEGAQGCDLDLNHSGNYPYVTSRNVSTSQLLADSGISPERLLETIMVIRPFPIRISNITTDGNIIYTGEYGSGIPLTWTQVNLGAKLKQYPFYDDVSLYPYHLDEEYLKHLYKSTNPIYLKQIFGEQYNLKNIDTITLLEALELERLYVKSNGKKQYKSKILELDNLNIIDLSEQTTVTKMERRIFDLDIKKLKNNCRINTPYGFYLNFFQHLDLSIYEKKGLFQDYYFDKYIKEYLYWIEKETGVDILALGTSPKNNDRILKKSLLKK